MSKFSYQQKVEVIAGMVRTLDAKGGDDHRLPILKAIHHDLLKLKFLNEVSEEMKADYRASNPQPQASA